MSIWQRRYLLKHYRRTTTKSLASGAGLSPKAVRAFLIAHNAIRSPADQRRIAKWQDREPPLLITPGGALRRVTQIHSRSLSGLDAALLVAMFIGSLVLYAITAARTVTGEDAGELLAAAHGFGVPHPPGYPLWLVLAWSFDHGLPWGTVAWRVTLVSGVFSALANTTLLALCFKTLRSRAVAFAGASLFAVSLTHWTQAVIPEVYGLNTFFVVLCALLLVRLKERPTAGRLVLLAFVAGLSCTNHMTAVPVAGVAGIAAVLIAPALFKRPTLVAGALAAGMAPLALYLVLPWASAREPYLDWGNPETTSLLWAHMTRAQYASAELAQQTGDSYGDYLQRLGILARSMGSQFGTPWVLVLSLVGFFVLMVRQTGLWMFLVAVGWLCSVGLTRFTHYSFDREHVYANLIFFIPAWLALAWLAAGGMEAVVAGSRQLAQLRWKLLGRLPAAAAIGCVALCVVPATTHYDRADRSGTTLVANYGKALLDAMGGRLGLAVPRAATRSLAPRNALASGARPDTKGANGPLYFPSSDHSTFAVLYWQGVEGYGLDVTVADKYGVLEQIVRQTVVGTEDEELLASLRPSERRRELERLAIEHWPGPVYFANRRDMSDVPDWVQEPVGPLFLVMRPDEARAWWQPLATDSPEEASSAPPGLGVWDHYGDLLRDDPVEGLDFTVQMVRADLRYMRGFALARAGRIEQALEVWSRIDADLAPVKQLYNNIGSALAEQGRPLEALAYYEKAIAEDSDYVLALRNQARIYAGRGELDHAVVALQAVLAAAPDMRGERVELARLLGRQDHVVEALAQYEELARSDATDPLPWREAGELLDRIGDLAKAQEAFSESLRLDPNQDSVAGALDRIRRGLPRLHDRPSGGLVSGASVPGDPFGAALGAAVPDLLSLARVSPNPQTPSLPGPPDALLPGAPQPPSPTEGLARLPRPGERP